MLNYPINDTEFNENCFKIICKWTYKRLHKSCSIAEKMAHKGNLEKRERVLNMCPRIHTICCIGVSPSLQGELGWWPIVSA